MKLTKNKRTLFLSEKSPYFETVIFVLKDNLIAEEDAVLNEARAVLDAFEKKCGRTKLLRKNRKKHLISCLFFMALGAVLMYIVSMRLS